MGGGGMYFSYDEIAIWNDQLIPTRNFEINNSCIIVKRNKFSNDISLFQYECFSYYFKYFLFQMCTHYQC